MSLVNQFKNKSLKFVKSKPVQMSMFVGLALLARSSFAEDALSGAASVVSDTYNGTMKTYLYVGEAIAAIATLIFTRNIKALGGIGAVAIFLNVVASLAGI